MSLGDIIELLKVGIPNQRLGISKKHLQLLGSNMLIGSMDIITSTGNFTIEGAIKLKTYIMLRKMRIDYSMIHEFEKRYRADRMYAKSINFHGYEHVANIFTKPILYTLISRRHYISIDPVKRDFDFLTDEDYMMCISAGKSVDDLIHGRIIFDLWEFLSDLGIEKPNRTKGMVHSLNKILEKNRFPTKIGKHYYLSETEYFDKPKQLGQSILSIMSEPHTTMTLKSNNHGYITSLIVTRKTRVENNTE